ncbi:TlpA disulfide reductase family protein [uncultured Psychroserpens sp.]|uniref:TlpA family protein disulfide reductase n=1 Tax=uncultured Psychroserpens sp. TaxID=255436 RepID=UPI00261DE04B|nr:TlpA disulfide reductase family protein [uncultured Psychroserpens sp.]
MKKIYLAIVLIIPLVMHTQENNNASEIILKFTKKIEQIKTIKYNARLEEKATNNGPNKKSFSIQSKINYKAPSAKNMKDWKALVDANICYDGEETKIKYAYQNNTVFIDHSGYTNLIRINEGSIRSAVRYIPLSLVTLSIDNQSGSLIKNKDYLLHDIKHQLLGEEKINGINCYKIKEIKVSKHSKKIEKNQSSKVLWIGKVDYIIRAYETHKVFVSYTITDIDFMPNSDDYNIDSNKKEVFITSHDEIFKRPKKPLLKVGQAAPNWELYSGKGELKKLSELKGKIVVLDFWGTWCAPCIKAMPTIEKLHKNYLNKDVVVIGISVNDAIGDAEKFFSENNYTYLHLSQGDQVGYNYNVRAYPTLYILDKQGKVLYSEIGFNSKSYEHWKSVINKHL